jgi:hypothetical protein
MAQKSPVRAQQSAPAEVLASLNLGLNGYTDPTLCNPRQWAAAKNAFSGAFGSVQRARFANVVVPNSGATFPISEIQGTASQPEQNPEIAINTTAPFSTFQVGQELLVTGTANHNGAYSIVIISDLGGFRQIFCACSAAISGQPTEFTGSIAAGYAAQSSAFTTFKFFSLPGLSNYLIADANGKLFSFDTGANYLTYQRINKQVDPSGTGSASLNGPWSREVLQNILYEMNGTVKQAGRLANAVTIEGLGLDAPDVSPQVVISAGSSQTITNIQRSNGIVTVTLGAALTVPGGNGIGMVNVTISVGDISFVGTFLLLTGSGTATLTWQQFGQNTALLTPTGTVNTNITKSIGRSYAYAWENANKNHMGAPSPATQFIQYTNQNGVIQLIEQGTVSVPIASGSITVTGTGTAFTSAWIGRYVWVVGGTSGSIGHVLSVASPTSMIVSGQQSGILTNVQFQVYDPQATHLRLYETADGGATFLRTQRNAWVPSASTLAASGLQFFDNGQSEPPNFPFTTEVSQLFNVPPPVGAFLKEYQARLLIYGGTIPGQTFFYSNIESTTAGLPQESVAPLNQITLPIQNANISGMADLPGSLIIWSDKQDMFRLTGLLSDNTPLGLGAANTAVGLGTQIVSLPYNLGCANPFAVVVTPLGAIWVTSNRELWLYTDKYAPRNIGRPIQNILRNIPANQLANVRLTYYHSLDRNWVAIALSNGASNNVLVNLDLDLLASNGSPSFFLFDMATNHPAFWIFSLNCNSLETVYEQGGAVRLVCGSTDLIQDADYQTGLFGTETPVSNGNIVFHAWGNDSAFMIKRPSWLRFTTNQDPSQLALQGWSFAALGIDDDFYTFASPLVLTLQPGVNDSSSLCGNPNLASGEAFRHSPEMFKIGGVNFVMGRRIQFVVNFPSGTGVNYALRSIQLGFGPSPPR